jgi:very-short-patch-repair endonuclease
MKADGAAPAQPGPSETSDVVARLKEKLDTARRDLLDLSARNRLINTARKGPSFVDVVDERSEQVFKILVRELKSMTFLPRLQTDGDNPTDAASLPQPDTVEDEAISSEPAAHHLDLHLQSNLVSESLQKRLLKIHNDARTVEEEQGTSVLYLALGFLKWFEDERSDKARYAPLVLVPVELERKSAASRFTLSFREAELSTNLSLQERIKVDFGIPIPDLSDQEYLSPDAYFASVRAAVSGKTRWQVLGNEITLGLFSFARFLMYKDLKDDSWPPHHPLSAQPFVRALVVEGFRQGQALFADDASLDEQLHPRDVCHVLDADSSQTVVIEEVTRGRSLVVQGPPGTGKSQTITNIIAASVKAGKRVLFVAEKMAALQVVKSRLDNLGLGDICLELHSRKANKRAVLVDLESTLALARPGIEGIADHADELARERDDLNRHVRNLHEVLDPAGITPYQVMGEMVALRARGVQPAAYRIAEASAWNKSDRRQRRQLVEDLCRHLSAVGNPSLHPWRGVNARALLPPDVDRLQAALAGVGDWIERHLAQLGALATDLELGNIQSTAASGSRTLLQTLTHVATVPALGRAGLSSAAWSSRRADLENVVAQGSAWAMARESLANVVADVAWQTDMSQARIALATHGRSWFRFLIGDYRRAQGLLRGILRTAPPAGLEERLEILDTLVAAQRGAAILGNERMVALGEQALKPDWLGESTDWNKMRALLNWEQAGRDAGLSEDFRILAATIKSPERLADPVLRATESLDVALAALRPVLQLLRLDFRIAFGVTDLESVPLALLRDRIAAWRGAPDQLSSWMMYRDRWERLAQLGLAPLAERVAEGALSSDQLRDSFEMAWCEALMADVATRHPDLISFDGTTHQATCERFRAMDRERIRQTRQEVAHAHWNKMPHGEGELGEMAVLRQQMKRKRGHMALRRLLKETGRVIQTIKPVFLMSPLSVAQFLEPGGIEFDILLIDEASQVRPVDALGAIARAGQLVIVGDEQQLPPSNFFGRAVDSEETGEEEGLAVGDVESILALCEAQGLPQRMLRWHYRSRHQSLIEVSNRRFYGGSLFIVPSPQQVGGEFGLHFRHLPHAVYDRGGTATNRDEAKEVARAVFDHISEHPGKSLGVGAFSVAQRDAIIAELELLRRASPETEDFFAEGRPEAFFVKNLENIQGDERDVIFVSVGYGRDAAGGMFGNFGPVSQKGGGRRMNVLMSRARERCELFSSITDEDIDLKGTAAGGTEVLKLFLKFARTGKLDVPTATGMDPDSPFEQEVANALRARGYLVDGQVGTTGFLIDLAVKDPDRPGRYLLGVECDGAQYHSSRWARDRDRLRQEALESRGWTIHRIWSTDWFHRPKEQTEKVIEAIERVRALHATPVVTASTKVTVVPGTHSVLRHAPEPRSETPVPRGTAYREAAFPVDREVPIHELDPVSLRGVISQIIEIEGPIHHEEIARRLTTLWGLKRTGSRITEAVANGLSILVRVGQVVGDGVFYALATQREAPVRDRGQATSQSLRKPEFLPPDEVRQAALVIVRDNPGVTADTVVQEGPHLLGWKSTSEALREMFEKELRHLVESGACLLRDGRLYDAPPVRPLSRSSG